MGRARLPGSWRDRVAPVADGSWEEPKYVRELLKLTKSEAADLFGVTGRTWSTWETGCMFTSAPARRLAWLLAGPVADPYMATDLRRAIDKGDLV